jgi:hypothetical protein
MDDLYGNAWGDPLNNYSTQPYPLPTWNTQVSSPKPQSPVEDDQNDHHVSDDESEDLTAETQSRAGASDASWTADAIPWPLEENQGSFSSAWMSPTNVWSPAEQPQTTAISAPGGSEDIPPKSPPLASPTLSEEPNGDHTTPLEQAQDTPVQSRAHSPDQFGTFESGTADATDSTEEAGWGSPKYSSFDESVDPSNAWCQRDTAKAHDAEPVDEWEAARQMKEKVDRRVVRTQSNSLDFDLLNTPFSPRKSLQASSKLSINFPKRCGRDVHRVIRKLKKSGCRAGDVVSMVLKACE